MAKKSFKPGTMLNPVPVVMVSCGQKEDKNIITIAWTGIVNSQPPMTYVSVRKSRHSHEIISKEKEFVINLTTEALAKETDFCGVKSGKDINKAKHLGLTYSDSQIVSCPIIEECPVNLECKVVKVLEFNSHDMFLAEIVNVNVDESMINEKGRIMLDEAGLLAYNHGEYFGLKKFPLGKFGYSIMKNKTKKRIATENKKKYNKK